jgi:RNA 3'-terminal phosphate cyclase-like protein
LATLTGRTLIITDIRADAYDPGLTEFEGSFLRLIDKVTNGCQVRHSSCPAPPRLGGEPHR